MNVVQLIDPTGNVLHSRRVPKSRSDGIRFARIIWPRYGYPRIAELYQDWRPAFHKASGTGGWALPVIGGKVRMPV